MTRKFKDMQTEEQRYAAAQAQRPAPAPSRPPRPASNAEWRQMTTDQQAAHLARLDGREEDAREWERYEAEQDAPKPKRRWF